MLEQYQSVRADVNVLAFVTQFIPLEVCDWPAKGSICYHPSILPKHRGASAINWTLMAGETETGFSLFYPDAGLDTGPVLLTRTTPVLPDDTVITIYKRFQDVRWLRGPLATVVAQVCAWTCVCSHPVFSVL